MADRQGDDLEYALNVGYIFGLTLDYLPLLSEAAYADWHTRHEDVAQGLGQLGSSDALPALSALVAARPEYLIYDNAVPLARHALHGIERIGGDRARSLIEGALDDDREPVRADARRMLNRR